MRDGILHSHRIPSDRLRADDFYAFVDERRRLLLGLIEKAMGKPVRVDG
jgi:hypothetical protein